MLIRINPNKPNDTEIAKVVNCLRDGGVIIYPTDTVYGMGCDINKQRAVERVCKIKGIDSEKANFSFICHDLSHLSDFTRPISTSTYKLMKKALPGPFTFILEGNNSVPKLFKSKKKTVGIRIPNNAICLEIVKKLGNPIMSSSIHDEDELIEYTTDPDLIYEKYKDKVDLVIAGGYGNNEPSTIVDCTTDDYEILRQGLGVLEEYL
ncbi:MAG TPA: L-threonylcarbamoyladenylate synthase [Bacteroidia bacterium]|jgi:tRNA threonylcarbamoyl adenosine modification protein (Sua5/YciO/YrdC/YwlC family)|nr:L-threonylcarbamoyladenylate synthase [Bacteroidia bacterium]